MTSANAEGRLTKYIDAVCEKSIAAPGVLNYDFIGLNNDLYYVKEAFSQGGFKGCRVEVDLETAKDTSYFGSKPARLADMQLALKTYLQESQIKANITINDIPPNEYFRNDEPLELKKGRIKDRLHVENDDLTKEEFASVYVARKTDKDAAAKMIVRVDGASMFSEYINGLKGIDVIVEIDPKLSRQVLNSNRDGMARRYNRVVRDFNQKLAIDVGSALMDKKVRMTSLSKGSMAFLKLKLRR